MLRVAKELIYSRGLNDLPGIHYSYSIAHFGDDTEVVRYEYDSHIGLTLHVSE
jgi:hypothetical protein